MVAGPAMSSYRQSMTASAFDLPASLFEKAEKRERDSYERILGQNSNEKSPENAYVLHQELGETMLRDCTIERDNAVLDKVLAKIGELDDRVKKVRVTDTASRMNQGAQFVRHLENMLLLARVIAQGARNRDESRGAHYKPAFPKRDDASWMRTTLARHKTVGSVEYIRSFDYACAGKSVHVTDEVDISLVKPRERKYEQAGAASAVAQGGATTSTAPVVSTANAKIEVR
jgi:succinate dehydrogenase / fumarate reductase flavoprotein subunit